MKQPLVSIVITSYNYGKYIRSALQSVKNQTYRPIECIVVDDASTDDSVRIIREFIKENPETSDLAFSLVQMKNNSGQLAAFDRGIQESKGIFLNFLDADDMLLADFINTHVQVLLNTNVGMSVSEQIIVDETSSVISLTEDDPNTGFHNVYPLEDICECDKFSEFLNSMRIPENEEKLDVRLNEQYLFGFWFWRPTSNILFRRGVLSLFNLSGEYEKWRICADRLLLNLVHYTAGSCHVSRRLAAYRRHGMNSFNKRRVFGMSKYIPNIAKEMDGTKEKTALSIFSIFRRKMERNDPTYSDAAFFRDPVQKILPGTSPIFILLKFPLWSRLVGGFLPAFILLLKLPFLCAAVRIKKLVYLLRFS